MTWYPGDEHVFSVVVIVLARSPDCNLSSLVISCVPAALPCCVVSDSSVLHLPCILWTVIVSTEYLCQVCSSSVRNSSAHPQTAVDKLRYSCKVDSVFTSGFGARVEGPKREYVSSRDWIWDDVCGRAFWRKNERVRETSND